MILFLFISIYIAASTISLFLQNNLLLILYDLIIIRCGHLEQDSKSDKGSNKSYFKGALN